MFTIKKFGVFDYVLLLLVVLVAAWMIMRSFTITDYRPDGEVFVVAGHSIINGQSPYDENLAKQKWQDVLGKEQRSEAIFAYPPTALAFFAGLGLVPPKVGLLLIDALNALAYIGLLATIFLLILYANPNIKRSKALLGVLLAAIPMAISANITNGQSSMILVSIMVFSFYLLVKEKPIIAVFLLGIVLAIKPNYTFVPILAFILLCTRPKIWLFGFLGFLLWTILTACVFGLNSFSQFLQVITQYAQYQANDPKGLSGFPFGIIGLHPGVLAYIAMAIALLFILYLYNRKYLSGSLTQTTKVMAIQLIVVVVEFCLPLHEYDQILITIVLGLAVLQDKRLAIPTIIPLLIAARSSQIIYTFHLQNFVAPAIVTTIALALATIFIVANFNAAVRKIGDADTLSN